MSETIGGSSAVPNWYPDPADARLLRYWDGTQWTQHTSAAGAFQPGMSGPANPGSKTAVTVVVVLVGVLVLLVIIGILAAIAIPVFLSQRAKAADASTKADVSTLGKEIATWYVENDGPPPVVETDAGAYYVDGVMVGAVSTDVVLGGQTGSGANDWCVWVTNPQGDLKAFRYSAAEGPDAGTC